jgi:hypothetical protein
MGVHHPMIYDVTLATVTAMLFPTHTHFAVFSFEFIQPKRFAKKTNHNLVHTDFTDLLNIAKKNHEVGTHRRRSEGGTKKTKQTREREATKEEESSDRTPSSSKKTSNCHTNSHVFDVLHTQNCWRDGLRTYKNFVLWIRTARRLREPRWFPSVFLVCAPPSFLHSCTPSPGTIVDSFERPLFCYYVCFAFLWDIGFASVMNRGIRNRGGKREKGD